MQEIKWYKMVLIVIFLLLLFAALWIHFIPSYETFKFDIDVSEVREDGEVVGSQELLFQVQYYDYLIGEDKISIEIESFKEYVHIKVEDTIDMFEVPGRTFYAGLLSVNAFNKTMNSGALGNLIFTSERDRFLIYMNDDSYYTGSVSGNYTTREIIEYFEEFINTGITLPEE